jgi:hypothetical protein
MTTTTKSKPLRLTRRDIDVLRSLALYKRLSTQQIGRLHFPNTHKLTVNRRMLELRGTQRDPSDRYVSCVFSYPKATTNEQGGRKTAIYFLTPTNVRNIMRHLSQRGQRELAGELQDLPTIETGTTSHKHLTHELGISEWFITLCEAAQDAGDIIPFWEQTSTAKYFHECLKDKERFRNAQITSNGKSRTQTLDFCPDAYFAFKHTARKRLLLPFFEFDNSTESLERWRTKIAGYVAFLESGKLPDLILYLSDRYNLGLSPQACTQFDLLVLTATPTEHRRNQLARETSRLPAYREHFLFSSMTDTNRSTILSDIWLSAEDYRPLYDRERSLPAGMRASVRAKWITDEVATLKRRSLLVPW